MTWVLHRRRALAVLVSLAAGCSTAATGEPTQRTGGSPTPSTAPPATAIDAGAATAPTTGDASAGDANTGVPVPAGTSYAAVLRSSDWAKWPGLPADLHEADLVHDLGLGRAKTSRHDGRLSRRDAVIVETPTLRYWLRDRNRVVLIEVTKDLGATPPATLRTQLGTADREGAGRFLQSGATTTEYVYARRGLALTVAESYDQPPSFTPRLAAIQLFTATDLRSFVLELGGNDRAGPTR